jgi:hypothetical protein
MVVIGSEYRSFYRSYDSRHPTLELETYVGQWYCLGNLACYLYPHPSSRKTQICAWKTCPPASGVGG